MLGLLLGLGVAFVGALLLAAGVELQSRAVHAADGQWRTYLRSRRWLVGLALLGMAVLMNLIALALAPVSAVQSVNIIALAASTAFNAQTHGIVLTRGVKLSILACIAGVLVFIAVIAAHPGGVARPDLQRQRPAVMTIQASLALAGALLLRRGRRRSGRTAHLLGMVVAAMGFAAITAVVKVHVELVQRDGPMAILAQPDTVLALAMIAVGGLIASVHLQHAHRVLAAPAAVAGMTITDTVTAATIGILVLGESSPTASAGLLLLVCAAVSIAGVTGLGRVQRPAHDGGAPTEHEPDPDRVRRRPLVESRDESRRCVPRSARPDGLERAEAVAGSMGLASYRGGPPGGSGSGPDRR